MHDEMAWAAFATYGTPRIVALSPKFALQLLEESEGKSKAWAELAPEYAALPGQAQPVRPGYARTVPLAADAAGAVPVFLHGRGLQMLARRVLAGQPGTGVLSQVRWTAANAAAIARAT